MSTAIAQSRARRALSGIPLILLAAMLLASCGASVPAQRGASAVVVDRLYFGRSIEGGGMVSDAEWGRFVEEVVVARFPEGHTAWGADGAWRDGEGRIVREKSFVLELLHPVDAAGDMAIEAIIDAYKARFRQQSVLWVREGGWGRF